MADSGMIGYIPLENMGRNVMSDESQDVFAMGVVMDTVFVKEQRGENLFYYVSFRGKSNGLMFSLQLCDQV